MPSAVLANPRNRRPTRSSSHPRGSALESRYGLISSLAIYTVALTETPGDKVLEERGAALWDRQARLHFEPKEWKRAVDLYEQGLNALIQRLILLECNSAPNADSLSRSTIGASMAIQTVNRELPAGHSRKERSSRLLSLLGGNEVRNLGFADSLTNFDFGGVHFENCSFESISFIGCTFDARTTFRRCVFAGITVVKSESLAAATIDASCSVDPELRRQLVNEPGAHKNVHKYTVHDLRVDFETALRRITPNELPAEGSFSEAYINRGRLAASPYQRKIMAVLKRHVLEFARSEDSGVGRDSTPSARPDLAIRPNVVPALHFFRGNGVLSGPLALAWEELSRPLFKS